MHMVFSKPSDSQIQTAVQFSSKHISLDSNEYYSTCLTNYFSSKLNTIQIIHWAFWLKLGVCHGFNNIIIPRMISGPNLWAAYTVVFPGTEPNTNETN